MMTTNHGTTDFPVQNVLCVICDEMMYFSHSQSNSENAIFYCANDKCEMLNFFMYVDETTKIPVKVKLERRG